MLTSALRVLGALPVTPETVTELVTAAPASGMVTAVLFSNTLPPGSGLPPPGRAPTLMPAQAWATAAYSGLVAPYSSLATASVPVRAAA
ncbi:hypothetical protein SGRI78S_02860 [Streptomyces griseus subsp. griseus]